LSSLVRRDAKVVRYTVRFIRVDADCRPVQNRRGLAVVFLVVFVDLAGFGIVIPILPFFARSFGASELVIGLLAATYSLMQFGFAPLLGALSDRYGRRLVMVVSLAGAVIAWTIFGFATGLATLFVARGLAGAMGGNIAAAQASVADLTTPEERPKALGYLGAAFGLGFVFGPAIGAALAFEGTVAAVDGIAPAFVPVSPFSLPAFGAAATSLLALVLAATLLPATKGETERESQLDALRSALAAPGLRGLLGAFFLVSFAFSGVQIMFIPYVADIYGYTESQAALLLAYIGVLAVVVQGGLIGPLTSRYGDAPLTVFGAGCLAVSLVGIPVAPAIGRLLPDATGVVGFLTPQLLGLLVVLAALSLGNGVLSVTLTALVSKGAGSRQGSAFGLTQGAGSLARTIGPVVMGGLYTAVAYWAPFVLGFVLLLPVVVYAVGLPSVAPERPADPGHVR
jgi:DHA1 family tetracycline resistance protein-like MFS transporter